MSRGRDQAVNGAEAFARIEELERECAELRERIARARAAAPEDDRGAARRLQQENDDLRRGNKALEERLRRLRRTRRGSRVTFRDVAGFFNALGALFRRGR